MSERGYFTADEMPKGETALEARNISVIYGTGAARVKAVDSVSLKLNKGELTVIFGASGCGKTSMMNVFGGMLAPSSGRLLWRGKNIARMSDREKTLYRQKQIGFVFQQYNLISDLTAEDNVGIAAALADRPMDVHEALEIVGLKDRARHYPYQMSGGEQQRVCIARALVKKPDIIFCDEPTGALDTENARRVLTILERLRRKEGRTVVIITHNPAIALMADRLIKMSNGRILSDERNPFPQSAEEALIL